jgi:hypothetical protein
MRRLFTVGALGLVLGVMAASSGDTAHGDGLGTWIKFLFPPQAGSTTACLSCGWHGACTDPPTSGRALDFAGTCTGTRQVYFRAFGFLPPDTPTQYVGYAAEYVPPEWECKEVRARVWDWHGNHVVTMRYVHTENAWQQAILLYASGAANGYLNEHEFAEMTTMERQLCIDLHWWYPPPPQGDPVHVHEADLPGDGNSTVFLRDGGPDGNCQGRYPCAPEPSPGHLYYNPHDLTDSWARITCFDDIDCDGWTDSQESYVGTDPWDSCPDNVYDAAWPPDIDNSTRLNTGDVLKYKGKIGTSDHRFDLNASGRVDVGDILLYKGHTSNEPCP